MSCQGITTKGEACRLQANPRFGSYCHHHCRTFFMFQQMEAESKADKQSALVSELQKKLQEALKRNPDNELARIASALNKAQTDLNQMQKQIVKAVKDEAVATRELISDEADATREYAATGFQTLGAGICKGLAFISNQLTTYHKQNLALHAPATSQPKYLIDGSGYNSNGCRTMLLTAQQMPEEDLLDHAKLTSFVEENRNAVNQYIVENKNDPMRQDAAKEFFTDLMKNLNNRLALHNSPEQHAIIISAMTDNQSNDNDAVRAVDKKRKTK